VSWYVKYMLSTQISRPTQVSCKCKIRTFARHIYLSRVWRPSCYLCKQCLWCLVFTLAYPVQGPFVFLLPKTIRSFSFERTCWRVFQKRVMCTKFKIYVFIIYEWWEETPSI